MDASPQIIVPRGSSAKSASVWEADGLSRARVTAHARRTGGAVTRVGARASLRHLGGFECVHAGPSHAPRRRSASESCFFDKLSESVSQKVLPEPVPWKRVRPSGSTCQRPRTPATRHAPGPARASSLPRFGRLAAVQAAPSDGILSPRAQGRGWASVPSAPSPVCGDASAACPELPGPRGRGRQPDTRQARSA